MLILSRKTDQRIMIGDDIVIQIVQVKENGDVAVGIEAPRDVPIHREEIYRAIKKERGE